MTSVVSSFLLLLSSLALLSIAKSQDRAPHGIAYENPVAFSPSAYEFFHPKTQDPDANHPCAAASSCSPLPVAVEVRANQALESKVLARQNGGGNRLKAGGVAAIVFGCAIVVLLGMGVYYLAITRRANLNRAKSVQPEA
ncbi:hypothetical protein SLA2020_083630 [Shorea laevis]